MKPAPASGTRFIDRAFKMGREEMLLEVLPPLDWDKVGTETWGEVIQTGQKKLAPAKLSQRSSTRDEEKNHAVDEAVFRPSASQTGGREIPNTTPRPMMSQSLN